MSARPSVGLIAACDDPQLLAFPLWPKQRALLAAVDDGPRLHVWALGRRSAKTTSAALVALWDCLLRPELDAMVRPGERRNAVAVATNVRQARLFVRAARSIVARSPLLRSLLEGETEDELLFANGTALSAFPCTSRGSRGWPISLLLLDEAAHFLSETEGHQVAERVFEALVPSTAQFGDAARIIVASTPFGLGRPLRRALPPCRGGRARRRDRAARDDGRGEPDDRRDLPRARAGTRPGGLPPGVRGRLPRRRGDLPRSRADPRRSRRPRRDRAAVRLALHRRARPCLQLRPVRARDRRLQPGAKRRAAEAARRAPLASGSPPRGLARGAASRRGRGASRSR